LLFGQDTDIIVGVAFPIRQAPSAGHVDEKQ